MRVAQLLSVLAGSLYAADGQATINCSSESNVAQLYVLAVNATEYLGWSLECDDGIRLWDVPIGEIADADTEVWLSREACVDENATCHFQISSTGHTFYSLTYGATTVAFSNDRDEPDSEKTFCFGPRCWEPPLERKEDPTEGRAQDVIAERKYSLRRSVLVIWVIAVLLTATSPLWLFCCRARYPAAAETREGGDAKARCDNASDSTLPDNSDI